MQVLLLVSAISLFAMLIEDGATLSQIEFWLSLDWKKFEPPAGRGRPLFIQPLE